jgi:uncharacterized protein (TIGR03083 family)
VTIDREELVAAARAEREGLGRTIQYAPADCWEQPSAIPGWWARDVIAHLAGQDYSAAQLLAGEEPTELSEYRAQLGDEPFTMDGYNQALVNHRSGLHYREVLTQWGRAADLFLEHAANLPDEEWNGRRVDWVAGDIGIPYLLQSRVVEWWIHGDDVRLGAGMEPRVQHWPIFLTNDLAVRMLPWALARANVDARGSTVQVDVEGAGGGLWHWGLGPGEVPRTGSKPDAFVQGRALAFALAASRRMPAETYLDDGNLVVGGDEALAIEVLTHLRAYP